MCSKRPLVLSLPLCLCLIGLLAPPASIVANAVPGLDGGANNQDFALYVSNATQ